MTFMLALITNEEGNDSIAAVPLDVHNLRAMKKQNKKVVPELTFECEPKDVRKEARRVMKQMADFELRRQLSEGIN